MKGKTNKNNSTDGGKTQSLEVVLRVEWFILIKKKKKKGAGRPEVSTEKEYIWTNLEGQIGVGRQRKLSAIGKPFLTFLGRKKIQPVFCIPGILFISPLQSHLEIIFLFFNVFNVSKYKFIYINN